MTKRQFLVWLAFLVLLAILSFGLAWRFGENDPTRQFSIIAVVVAVGGFLLNFLKTLLDVNEKEREKRKSEEDKKDRLIAIPQCDVYDVATRHIGVQIYNEGRTTVTIRCVALVLKTDETENQYLLYKLADRNAPGMSGYEETCKLNPHDHAVYFEAGGSNKLTALVALASMPAENLWIVIEAFSGAKFIIPGADIQAEIMREGTITKG